MNSHYSRVDPSSNMTGVFIERENLDRYRGKCHVKMGVMLPQAKEPPKVRRETWNRSFPRALVGSVGLPTTSSWASSLQNCELINFCSENYLVAVLCYHGPRKLIHSVNRAGEKATLGISH